MHPLIDFSNLSIQELLEKHQEYTKKLYKLPPGNSLYNSVVAMRDAVHVEYQERLYMQNFNDKKEEIEEVLDIGGIRSDVHTPDYSDDKDKLLRQFAMMYANKDNNSDN